MSTRIDRRSRIVAIIRQRCPRCLTGRVFRGIITTNETCPDCGLKLGREEGYFTGAMYVSYAIGLGLVFGIFWVLWIFSSGTLLAAEVLLGVTALLYLPLVPIVFRYSRVIWLHLDYKIDPWGGTERGG